MNSLTKTILLIFITIIYGCRENRYSINEEFIKGKIDNGFTIAELSSDKSSSERLRVCCEASSKKSVSTDKLFFHKKNIGYQWAFCTLDLRFVENDSLKELSFKEKMEILNKEEYGKPTHKNYDTLPIKFKPETWYQFFGFRNIEGSYFVYVEKDGSFKVEYFKGGPF